MSDNRQSNPADFQVPCRGCAVLLIERCYKKHFWFHLVRDPLVWAMKCLALVCGIDANRQPVKRAHCKGCVRFIKNGLEEKSPTFRFFNRLIAPGFSRLRNGMLTDEDMDAARRAAMEANSFEQHDTEN